MNDNGIRDRQNRVLLLLVFVGVLILSVFCYYLIQDDVFPPTQTKATVLPLDKSNPQDLRMTRLESEKSISDQKVSFLESAALYNAQREEEREQESNLLKEEIAKLKSGLRALTESPPVVQQLQQPAKEMPLDPFAYSPNNLPPPIPQSPHPVKVAFTQLVLDKPGSSEKLYHVDQVIPSGTSVKAILVSSVDMPCGVYSATDPQPVKLRLIDDGRLPRNVRAKLKGAIIIGSAHGDLSNERIYMRLERLTQIRADGKFIETGVAGYVTGEDGKYGIKGCVVDKSYKMVENAALSGVFNSISQYLQANATRGCAIYEQDYNVNSMNARDLTATAVSGGANGAFDILTQYYIRRAEQIRPVIKASAGRIVDVTFIHNAEIGDLHVKDRVRTVRELSRRDER